MMVKFNKRHNNKAITRPFVLADFYLDPNTMQEDRSYYIFGRTLGTLDKV